MNRDNPGTKSALGRAVSAEARARLAKYKVSGKAMAARMGVSQTYLSKRLRDAAPFTLDDVESLVSCLDPEMDVKEFISTAVADNWGQANPGQDPHTT